MGCSFYRADDYFASSRVNRMVGNTDVLRLNDSLFNYNGVLPPVDCPRRDQVPAFVPRRGHLD